MRSNAVPAAILAALLIACGGRQEANTNTAATATDNTAHLGVSDTATHPASPGGAALVPEAKGGTTVIVTLEDGRLAIADADRIPPGPAVFTVSNTGKTAHNLYIEGPGANRAAGDNLPAGATTSVSVELAAGNYTVYCPVLDHRNQGESVQLIIKPADAPPPTSTAVPSTPTNTANTGTTQT